MAKRKQEWYIVVSEDVTFSMGDFVNKVAKAMDKGYKCVGGPVGLIDGTNHKTYFHQAMVLKDFV